MATNRQIQQPSNVVSIITIADRHTQGEALRTSLKLLFLGIISVAVITAGLLIVRSMMNQQEILMQPTDATLEANFKQHESDLELLADMSQADSRVVRVAKDFTWLDNNAAWPRPDSELGFSHERWEQYRQLFKKAGLEGGLTREEHGEVIYFIFSSKGLVTHGTEKGYAFSKKELTPTADSLDDFARMPKGQSVVFKKLKEHWYLFYMSS